MSSAQRFSSRSGTKTLIGKESRTAISDVGALANQVPRFVTRARVSHLLTVPEEEVRQIARDAGLGCVERVGKCGRPNLEGGRHKLFRLTGRVFPGSDFAPGLVELGLGFGRQLQSILKIIIDPFTDLLDFLAGQIGNRCSNFLSGAHGQSLRWKAFARNDVK